MDLVPDDKKRGLKTPVWEEYKHIITDAEGKEVEDFQQISLLMLCIIHLPQVNVELLERFAFYERAKQAFAVVATG